MGQYHIIVNLDKQEYFHPHDLGWGLKQKEHTGFAGSAGDAIYLLTQTSPNRGGGDFDFYDGVSGRWTGDRVVVLGDYTEEEEYKGLGFKGEGSQFSSITSFYGNISDILAPVLRKAFKWNIDHYAELYSKAEAWDNHLKELALAE